ncbi:MAG: hypothetical protein K0Q65_816 [Clostridia bacterium]|jgi:hypothetical protein|nr:hypothetical protein [Clostridia bacterium]
MTFFKLINKKFVKLGLISALSAFLIAGSLTGCTASTKPDIDPAPSVEEPQVNDAAIMEDYKKLIENSVQPKEVFEFLDENAKVLTKENVALIMNDLEKLQKEYLPKLEEKYFESTELQKELIDLYLEKKDINYINDTSNIETEALKSLIDETRRSGYKVETAEGMFFPIVDYSAYKSYAQYISDDLKAYIEIMALESDDVPAKDAALVIGWDEVIDRAAKQEAFIKKYADSSKLPEVKQLYNKYLTFTFLGLNNTPLFSYDGNVMAEDAKAVYTKLDFSANDSEYMQSLKGFMELLKNSNYKLTPEIDKFRKAIIGN